MKKRVLVLLLSILFILNACCLVACRAPGLKIKDDTYDSEGKLEITYFSWDIGAMDTSKMSDVPVLDYIQKKFNIRIKPITAGYSGWENTLSTNIGAGEVPDMFVHVGFERPVLMEKWIKDQVFAEIRPDPETMPNLYKHMEKYKFLEVLSRNKPYSVPVAWKLDQDGKTPFDRHGLLVRKDWIQNLKAKGVDVFYPETEADLDKWDFDAFYKLLKAFAENDPNNTGKKDTYGLGLPNDGRTYWWYSIINMFGASDTKWTKQDDGTYMPDILSDEFKNAVAFIGKLLHEKILDPSYATTDIYKYKEKFVTGSVGVVPYNAAVPFYDDIFMAFESTVGTEKAGEMFDFMPLPKGVTGERYVQGRFNFWSQTSISNRITENKKTKIMQLLDFLMSEEGRTLLKFGIEGQHYRREGDKIINLIPNRPDGKENNINSIDPSVEALKKLVTWERFEEDPNVPAIRNREKQIEASQQFDKYAKISGNALVQVSPDKFDYVVLGNLDDIYIKGTTDALKVFKRTSAADDRTYEQKLAEFNSVWEEWTNNWYNKSNGKKYVELYNQRINEIGDEYLFY